MVQFEDHNNAEKVVDMIVMDEDECCEREEADVLECEEDLQVCLLTHRYL